MDIPPLLGRTAGPGYFFIRSLGVIGIAFLEIVFREQGDQDGHCAIEKVGRFVFDAAVADGIFGAALIDFAF